MFLVPLDAPSLDAMLRDRPTGAVVVAIDALADIVTPELPLDCSWVSLARTDVWLAERDRRSAGEPPRGNAVALAVTDYLSSETGLRRLTEEHDAILLVAIDPSAWIVFGAAPTGLAILDPLVARIAAETRASVVVEADPAAFGERLLIVVGEGRFASVGDATVLCATERRFLHAARDPRSIIAHALRGGRILLLRHPSPELAGVLAQMRPD